MFVFKKHFIIFLCSFIINSRLFSDSIIKIEKKNVNIDDGVINIEVFIRNNSEKTLIIPSREYFEYNQKSQTMFIKTFTIKEKKGDFSHSNDIQYKQYKEKELKDKYNLSDIYINYDDSSDSFYEMISEVKPHESIILFFYFKIQDIDLRKIKQIFLRWLYYEQDKKQRKIMHEINMKIDCKDFNLNSFDKYEYIPIWESDTIDMNNENDCY